MHRSLDDCMYVSIRDYTVDVSLPFESLLAVLLW